MSNGIEPREAWRRVQAGEARIFDLRTAFERRRYGAPPGSVPVSLVRHAASPAGPPGIYLCQHAVRSKLTLRNGADEVEGGFVAWEREGLPIARP